MGIDTDTIEREKYLLGMIDTLQTVIKDLGHNVARNSLEIEALKKKLATLEPMIYESKCYDDDSNQGADW